MPNHDQKIAIVSMSCRFPNANTPDEFWNTLMEGKDVISEIPKDRWDNTKYYSKQKDAKGKTNQNVGAFLKDIHDFDPFFFNISPKEAIEMSPSQKLMLELAWELVENSNMPYDKFKGSNTGVYIGNIWGDFENLRKDRNAEINSFSATGLSPNIIANRVSYHMGLTGPSFVLDTGCSSSLIAFMLAVQALRDGTVDTAIAGGINHILNQDHYIYLAKFGGLSSNGKCSAFSEDADGFVRAEGAGTILLKRLTDALRDGDTIHAVVCGGAINNNGFNDTMPATSVPGQLNLLKRAHADAMVDPKDIQYIETHGTGTKVGDPVEAQTLGKYFADKRINGDKLIIGSAKTNFGHTEAASGIAGMIKTVLSIEKGIIPKNLNFTKVNPKLDLEELKIEIPTEHKEWEVRKNQTRMAGVSSFGWGGSNAHVVLEQFKPIKNKNIKDNFQYKQHFVLPISARSSEALLDYAKAYLHLLENTEQKTDRFLAQLCASVAITKPDFEYRKAFAGTSKEDLVNQLKDFVDNEDEANPIEDRADQKIVFVFPGQGSQWFGMGLELYSKERVFRQAIDKCDRAFAKYVDWSLEEELFASKQKSKLDRIDVIQPYICAMQIAIAELWMSWGISPDSVVGHSMGEVAAAYISGSITIDDAANIICSRSLLMNSLRGQDGAMAVTGLSAEEAKQAIAKYNGELSVAVENSPTSTVIAGKQQAISKVLLELEKKEIFARQVKVDVASHSLQMDLIKPQLLGKIEGIKPQNSKIDIYSSVRGNKQAGEKFDTNYWGDNLRGTVKFSTVMDELINDKHSLFIEVSPHPVLKTPMFQCATANKGTQIEIINSLHKENGEGKEMQHNLAYIFEKGYTIKQGDFFEIDQKAKLKLPSYPFQRENYEIKDRSAMMDAGGSSEGTQHPLLGKAIHLAESNSYYWESLISGYKLPMLMEHKVNDTPIFPASFYTEMIFAATKQICPEENYQISDLQFLDAISISEEKNAKIQLKVETDEGKLESFKLFKFDEKNKNWTLCCRGDLIRNRTYMAPKSGYSYDKTDSVIEKALVYEGFANIGVQFGTIFQNVVQVKIDGNNIGKAIMKPQDNASNSGDNFVIHPVIIDSCIHTAFAKAFPMLGNETIKTAFVTGIKKVSLFNSNIEGNEFEARIKFHPVKLELNTYQIESDVALFDENYQAILELSGISAKINDTQIKKVVEEKADSGSLLTSIAIAEIDDEKIVLIENQVIKAAATIIKASPQKIKPSMTFKNLGIDSIATVMLQGMLEKDFELELSVQKFKSHPSIKAFSEFILELLETTTQENTSNASNIEISESDKWFVRPFPNPDAKHLLFLFHDAGGSKDLFEQWYEQIDETIEMVVVQLPGRNERRNEKPYDNVNTLLADLVPLMNDQIDRPYSIYGHSMGGLLGFEVARLLQNNYEKSPAKLMVSGTPCLKDYENKFVNYIIENKLTERDIHQLIPKFQRFDFDDGVVKNMISLLMNDLKLIHSYKYVPDEVLSSAIVAIHALNDVRVRLNDVEKWQQETQSKFKLHTVPGSHNFIYNEVDMITKLINKELGNELVEELYENTASAN